MPSRVGAYWKKWRSMSTSEYDGNKNCSKTTTDYLINFEHSAVSEKAYSDRAVLS